MTSPPADDSAGRVVVLAVLIGASYMFPLYLTGAVGVAVRADLGLDSTAFGAAISVFFAVGAVLMPVGGRIVDRTGPGPAVRLALAGAATCLVAVAALGGSYVGLCVAMAIGGVGSAVAAPVGGMLIARGVPPGRRALAFALERSSIPAATLVAGVCVPTLAAVLPWRAVFLCAAVLVALVLLLPVPHVRRAVATSSASAPLRPLGPLLVVVGMFVLGSAAATALSTFLVGYGVFLGLSAGTAGVALAVMSAATIGVRLLSGVVDARVSARMAVGVLLFLGAAGFLLLAVPVPVAALGGALVAGAAGWGWTGTLGHAVVRAHADAPGAATALVQAGGCAGGVLGPLLMGVLVEHRSYAVAWTVLAALVAVAGVAALANRGILAPPAAVPGVDPDKDTDLTSERTSVRLSGTGNATKGAAVQDGPLTGVRVLDVSTILAGPLCCRILGDHGAEVIKVEHPEAGDGMRGHGQAKDGVPLWWKEISRNKRTLGLKLSTPDGADLLLRLVATADVMVENFRPGTLERWGLGPDRLHEVNPGLVLVRVTGFGQTGPYAGRAGFGTLAEAMSGFAHMTGEADGPPTLPAFGLADSICGMAASTAAMTALFARERNGGRGDVVDINLLEPIMAAVGPGPTVYDQLGEVGVRHGNRSTHNSPRNTYLTKDGRWVAVSSSAQSIAERVLRLVGHPEVVEQPWFATGLGRAGHADLIDECVGGWIGERTEAEVTEAFEAAGAAVAPIYSARDLVEDEHVRETGMLTSVPDDDLGPVLMQNVLWRSAGAPGRIRFTGRAPGADTDDILAELGVRAPEVARLRADRTVA
ncbi:MFS transporter [Umezawaea tangerina]|uniref:Crotonobetainyl-CoA:carnitine CoA-transferase CaiB-like acyl-CoA transferase n=1 Tax=Umezawaea tangerina TaxID=84725 RepID=A0A2T0T293_9PSEU|nr:crotonobetainyl-CoA:carnitine CoA-transferase CaiB-like acyl-CoA transferase [Umezawaea tangerina]